MKRLFSILLTLLLTSAASHATPDLSRGRRGTTPYDPYLRPVRTVLQQLNGSTPSFQKVAGLLREAYGFEYTFDTPYVATMPNVTGRTHSGDCKAKSLWLASQMNDPSVRYVIGKARSSSKISHAWLMWQNNGRWWILDPTNISHPIAASEASANEYLVSYAYDQTGSYCYDAPARSRRTVAGRNR